MVPFKKIFGLGKSTQAMASADATQKQEKDEGSESSMSVETYSSTHVFLMQESDQIGPICSAAKRRIYRQQSALRAEGRKRRYQLRPHHKNDGLSYSTFIEI